MFKVGEIVKYSPRFCEAGEEMYIHQVMEVNPDTGKCLISTLNTSLTLGSSERVDEEMIVKAKKYEIIVIRDANMEQKYIITNTETKSFFAGYDFMGSIDWVQATNEAYMMDLDEAESILKDMEAAEDEPAEPEIPTKTKFEVYAKRWSNAEKKQIMFLVGEFSVYFHAELFAKAYSDYFKATTKIVEYKAIK